MKKFLIAFSLSAVAATSILLAQAVPEGILRLAAGDRPLTVVQQGPNAFVAADEVVTALGGTIKADGQGFRVMVNGVEGAFGPDGRFGVVRDDLVEMPAAPTRIEGRPFVPWQFFQGYLRLASGQDVSWDGKILSIRAATAQPLTAQVSVVSSEGISKIVIQLSGPSIYSVTREPSRYLLRFRNPILSSTPEQTFEDPLVGKVTVSGSEIIVDLTTAEVAGNSYRLESPFRLVLDLKAGVNSDLQPVTPRTVRPADLPGIRTIVLDPGHGGREVGAVGANGLMEKETTLAICRKLAAQLGQQLNVRVILTRTDDSVVSLDSRTTLANQYKADLFLSVHLNAAVARGAHGTETYFLSLDASDELARRAAERENGGAVAAVAPSSDLKLILWDLAQQDNLSESSRFAMVIQDEMNKATAVPSRGVKQAPFKVLVGATMPAALVEVGFISNPEEEARLKDPLFQDKLVAALTNAISRYKGEYEGRLGMNTRVPVAAPPAAAVTSPAPTPAAVKPPAPATGVKQP